MQNKQKENNTNKANYLIIIEAWKKIESSQRNTNN